MCLKGVVGGNCSNNYVKFCWDGGHLGALFFVAIPPSFPVNPVVTNVFRSTESRLMCPFQLGNLRNTLSPYSISWVTGVRFPMAVDSSQLSRDNRVLTVTIQDSSDSRTFQCILSLVRCNGTLVPCPERRHRGPLLQLQVFGKVSIVVKP